MIEVTNKTRRIYHAAFKKARKEKITVKRLASDLWYAARVAPGHGRYLIRFHVFPQIGGGEKVFVECRSVDAERCKGTLRRREHLQDPMCVHIATVIDRGVQYGKRKQKIESEKAA